MFNKLRPQAMPKKSLTLQLTDAEYVTLIRAVNVGVRVYGIMGDFEESDYKKVSDNVHAIQSKLLEHANEFGFDRHVELFEGEMVLNDTFEEKTTEDMFEYEEFALWNGLENLFAHREMRRRFTQKEWDQMDVNERIQLYSEAEEKWRKEFDDYDLERLEIDEKAKDERNGRLDYLYRR